MFSPFWSRARPLPPITNVILTPVCLNPRCKLRANVERMSEMPITIILTLLDLVNSLLQTHQFAEMERADIDFALQLGQRFNKPAGANSPSASGSRSGPSDGAPVPPEQPR